MLKVDADKAWDAQFELRPVEARCTRYSFGGTKFRGLLIT